MPLILVVDDDMNLRAAIRRMLEAAGFEVQEADGEQALLAFRLCQPDLVLSDMFMPGTDGIELIRLLSREAPGLRIVAMSGGGHKGSLNLLSIAERLGAAEVLLKPFQHSQILETIIRVLAAPPRCT